MKLKKPNLKKFKIGEILEVKFIDIHSNSDGWANAENSLQDTPCYVWAYGEYMGISVYNQLILGTMINPQEGYQTKYGVRIYIPVGCIVSIRKCKQ